MSFGAKLFGILFRPAEVSIHRTSSISSLIDLLVGESYETGRRTEAWANIAQVFSIYESRRNANDAKPFMRGINSIQLLNDGNRWWIVTVLWQDEDDKNKVPETYLKKPN